MLRQECIRVGCVPTARSRTAVGEGGVPDRDPPWTETLLDRDPNSRLASLGFGNPPPPYEKSQICHWFAKESREQSLSWV